MSKKIDQLNETLSRHLDEIRDLFKYDAKVTLVVRIPEMDDADTVISNDDDLEALIERVRWGLGGEPEAVDGRDARG